MKWRHIDLLGVIVLLLFFAWLAVPSSLFLRPVSLVIDGPDANGAYTAAFVRETPYGSVDARWRSEITLIDAGGMECNSGAWRTATYQPLPGNTARYQMGDWASPCLDAGPPYYITSVRQVLLGGWLPLRPMSTTTDVTGVRGVPLQINEIDQ